MGNNEPNSRMGNNEPNSWMGNNLKDIYIGKSAIYLYISKLVTDGIEIVAMFLQASLSLACL